MNEVKIFAIYSQFLGDFTANFKDTYSLYSLAYSPMCESSINNTQAMNSFKILYLQEFNLAAALKIKKCSPPREWNENTCLKNTSTLQYAVHRQHPTLVQKMSESTTKITRNASCIEWSNAGPAFGRYARPRANVGPTDGVPGEGSIPANTKDLYNVWTTLAQRLRRWSNIVQMLYKCFVFAGMHLLRLPVSHQTQEVHQELFVWPVSQTAGQH